jgi:hypothetical protein
MPQTHHRTSFLIATSLRAIRWSVAPPPSVMSPILTRLNAYLVRWARRKHARLQTYPRRAWQLLADVATQEPRLFVHWAVGQRPRAG